MSVDTISSSPWPVRDEASSAGDGRAASGPGKAAFNHPDGPDFSDLLDILNPLQHIPVISTIYQHLTGDKEGAIDDLAGGALWGGPIGMVAAAVNLLVEDNTGKTIGANLLAMVIGDDDEAVADATPAATSPEAAAPPAVTAAAPAAPVAPVADSSSPIAEASAAASAAGSAAGGPVIAGNYLVFGGAGSAMPLSLRPPPTNAAAMSATPALASTPASGSTPGSAADSAGVGRQGNFLIFGAGAPAAAAPPPMASAAAATPAVQTAQLPPARSFPVPPRRGPTSPSAVLPPPTTGPAAVPGNGPSQAIPAAAGDSWFVAAFNKALDKYDQTHKPADGTAGGTPDSGLSGTADGGSGGATLH